jgi:hypothetical protein
MMALLFDFLTKDSRLHCLIFSPLLSSIVLEKSDKPISLYRETHVREQTHLRTKACIFKRLISEEYISPLEITTYI